MIVEQRVYALHTGKVRLYLELYEREGLPVQLHHLPPTLGCYVTEVGPLNEVTHFWAYDSFEERMRRRTAMRGDPRWAPYLARVQPLICAQTTRILLPAPFFDLAAVTAALAERRTPSAA